MGSMKTLSALACGALLMTSATATAQGTLADRTTFVTFSAPVSIPGATLPAGTYTFKLADSPANRNIVQVFDKDQTKLFATLLAVAADRGEAQGDPVVTFRETAANRPPAVRYWYYAGERSGSEFVYPKSQAMEIARASGEAVMAVDTDSTNVDDWKNGTPTRVTADTAASTGSQTAPATAPPAQPASTAPATTAPAQPVTTAEPTTAPAAGAQPAPATASDQTAGTSGRSEPSELPRTASGMPVVGMIGFLALAGALALRARRSA